MPSSDATQHASLHAMGNSACGAMLSRRGAGLIAEQELHHFNYYAFDGRQPIRHNQAAGGPAAHASHARSVGHSMAWPPVVGSTEKPWHAAAPRCKPQSRRLTRTHTLHPFRETSAITHRLTAVVKHTT